MDRADALQLWRGFQFWLPVEQPAVALEPAARVAAESESRRGQFCLLLVRLGSGGGELRCQGREWGEEATSYSS